MGSTSNESWWAIRVPDQPGAKDLGYHSAIDLYAKPSAPRTMLQSAATTGGPSGSQPVDPNLEHPSPEPSAARVAADTVLGSAGALMAPEAAAGAIASRFAPQLIASAVQLLTRGVGAGTGLAASGEIFAKPNETPGEARSRRLFDLGSGVVGEGVGAGVTQAGTRAIGALPAGRAFLDRLTRLRAGKMEPDVPAIQAGLRARGGTLQPGQMTTNPTIDWFQNILESTISSQGPMAASKARNVDAAMQWVNEAAPRIAQLATPRQAGELVEMLVRDPLAGQRAVVRVAYRNLDSEIAAARIPPSIDLTPALQNFERDFATRIEKGNPDALRIQHYLTNAQPLTFEQADSIRSMLLDMGRSYGPEVSPTIRNVANHYASEVETSIQTAAQNAGSLGGAIQAAREAAHGARRMQANFFDDELIGPLLEKAAPERVGEAFFADNNPTQIRKLYDIVHEPTFGQYLHEPPEEYWRRIQGAWITRKRTGLGELEVAPGRFKDLDGKGLGEAMDQSKETFEALYPNPQERINVRRSARALEMTQSTAGSRTGTVLAQMAGGRAIGNAVSQMGNMVVLGSMAAAKGDLQKSFLIMMTPRVFAKAWASPHFSKWLLQKSLTREFRWSSNAGSLMAQGANALVKDRVHFTLYDPATDTATTHDPETGTVGPLAPTGKPTSKIRPQ